MASTFPKKPVLIGLISGEDGNRCKAVVYNDNKELVANIDEYNGYHCTARILRDVQALMSAVQSLRYPSNILIVSDSPSTIDSLSSKGRVVNITDYKNEFREAERDVRSLYRHRHSVDTYVVGDVKQILAEWDPHPFMVSSF